VTVRESVEAAAAEIAAANDRAWEILDRTCGWCGHRGCDEHADLDGLLYKHANGRDRSSLDGSSAVAAGRRTV